MLKKWKLFFSISLCLQWGLAPLAEAKELSKRQQVLMMLKENKIEINREITIGEMYSKLRKYLPLELAAEMDHEVFKFRLAPAPRIDVIEFKDPKQRDQVRILMKDSLQTINISTEIKNGREALNINGVSLDARTLESPQETFTKLGKELLTKIKLPKGPDKQSMKQGIVPTKSEWQRWSPYERAVFLVRIRELMDEYVKLEELVNKKQSKTSQYLPELKLLFGESAWAGSPLIGKACIIGGYVSKYVQDKEKTGLPGPACSYPDHPSYILNSQQCSTSSGKFMCNPIVYGYAASGGPHCVSFSTPSDRYDLTKNCNKASPLDHFDNPRGTKKDNIKRLVESHLKNKGLLNAELAEKETTKPGVDVAFEFNEAQLNELLGKCPDGKPSCRDSDRTNGFIHELQQSIRTAETEVCPKLAVLPPDQMGACQALLRRLYAVEGAIASSGSVDPAPVIAGSPGPTAAEAPGECGIAGDISSPIGSIKNADEECVCKDERPPVLNNIDQKFYCRDDKPVVVKPSTAKPDITAQTTDRTKPTARSKEKSFCSGDYKALCWGVPVFLGMWAAYSAFKPKAYIPNNGVLGSPGILATPTTGTTGTAVIPPSIAPTSPATPKTEGSGVAAPPTQGGGTR